MYGVEASINYDAEGVDNEFNYDDLEKLLHDYANKMRHYHMLLSNHYENIKLNLAAGDDPNIKHVIISNGHLDLAAKDIVPNRTQNYEIYNSIMTDTFLNLVHSIVENNSNPESNDIANTITLSNEVMDLNDMSGRTNPTSNATLLSYLKFCQRKTIYILHEMMQTLLLKILHTTCSQNYSSIHSHRSWIQPMKVIINYRDKDLWHCIVITFVTSKG